MGDLKTLAHFAEFQRYWLPESPPAPTTD
jgi:hypothetical protein